MDSRIGDWELLDIVGRGGMGVVYRARAADGTVVAVKVLKNPGSGPLVERFQRELRLATLVGEGTRGGFVPVLASGTHHGQPYLVMPLLSGGTLLDRITRGPMPWQTVVDVGIVLARALGRAHAAGVVHRDLKPENVLYDSEERPFIADLGLAKHFARDVPGASRSVDISTDGTRLGTTGYMAPEQYASAKQVGPPADVFSLGSVFYECLTGECAFLGESPSEIAMRAGSGDYRRVRTLRPEVPPWLAAVVDRCLIPQAEGRYQNGEELARDLERGGAPPRSSRAPVLLAVTLASVVLGGLALVRLVGQRRPATGGGESVVPATSAVGASPVSSPAPSPSVSPTPAAPRFPASWEGASRSRLLRLAWAAAPAEPGIGGAAVALGFAGGRAFALGSDGACVVWGAATGACERTVVGPGEAVAGGATSNGEALVAIGRDGSSTTWDLASGRELRRCAGGGELRAAATGGQGSVFLAVGRTGASIVEAATGAVVRALPGSRAPATVFLSQDGERAAVAGDDGKVAVVEVATGRVVHAFGPLASPVRQVVLDARGEHVLALFHRDEPVQLWDVDSGKALPSLGRGVAVRAAAFTPEGDRVVTGHGDGAIRIWDSASGRAVSVLEEGAKGESVHAVAVSPDGARALSAGRDRSLRLWDLSAGRPGRLLAGASSHVTSVAATASGTVVALDTVPRARGFDGTTGEASATQVLSRRSRGNRPALSPDGARIAVISEDGLSFYALGAGEVSGPFPVRQHGWIHELAFSPDGRRLVATTSRDSLVAWDADLGLELPRAEASPTPAATVAPTGSWVPPRPRFLAPVPAGSRVVVAGADRVEVRDMDSGESKPLDVVSAECAVVSPDGKRVLVGEADGRVALVDLETGRVLSFLEGHRGPVRSMAFAADGKRAASAAVDRTVRLWDLEAGRELDSLDLSTVPDRPTAVAFAAGGKLVVGTGRGAVALYEPRP